MKKRPRNFSNTVECPKRHKLWSGASSTCWRVMGWRLIGVAGRVCGGLRRNRYLSPMRSFFRTPSCGRTAWLWKRPSCWGAGSPAWLAKGTISSTPSNRKAFMLPHSDRINRELACKVIFRR
ncbi:hypothetical protein D3C81_1197640 [compost metagenome]